MEQAISKQELKKIVEDAVYTALGNCSINKDRLLPVFEAASFIGKSSEEVIFLVESGRLKARHIRGKILFTFDDLEEYLTKSREVDHG